MQVQLNGKPTTLPDQITVQELLQQIGIDPAQVGVAVAVNRRVIPRQAWKETPLSAGDSIELVYARQGG
jgi:sulfur carrier protein